MKKTTTEFIDELKKFSIDAEDLWVARVGEDFLIGVCHFQGDEAEMQMRNPKRIIRLQRVVGSGLEIELLLTDYDFLADEKDRDNTIWIYPSMKYKVLDQNEPTIQNILSHLIAFYESRKAASAVEAGLVLPPSAIKSPFRK